MDSHDESLPPAACDTPDDANVMFYTNRMPIQIRSDDYTIEEIHTDCFDDFELLEETHTYVQWLFPIDRPSQFNRGALPLTRPTATCMAGNVTVSLRLIYSLAIMLRFYGYSLDPYNASVGPAVDHDDRVAILNRSPHNWLRISRILRCLCLCGLTRYAHSFLRVLAIDVFETKLLVAARESFETYWSKSIHVVCGEWPRSNRADELYKLGTTTPDATKKFFRRMASQVAAPAGGLYAFRRLLYMHYHTDIEPDEMGEHPWLAIDILSPKKIFFMTPMSANIVVANPRNMRVKTVCLKHVYKARIRRHHPSFPSEGWPFGIKGHDGFKMYSSLQTNNDDSTWIAVWLKKGVGAKRKTLLDQK